MADIKAAIDYLEKLKKERLDFIKNQNIDSKEDDAYRDLDHLQFNLHQNLFKRLMKLKREVNV